MKTNKKQFDLFKHEFNRYAKLFSLVDFDFYYEHCNLDGAYACVKRNTGSRTATVCFAKKCPKIDSDEISKTALHEAIHLVLASGFDMAASRFCTEEQIYNTHEREVVMLTNIIYGLMKGE